MAMLVPLGQLLTFVFLAVLLARTASAQPQPSAPAPGDAAAGCNGILLNYTFLRRERIRPHVSDRDSQPYSFRATVAVVNGGTRALRSWAVHLTFAHGEILVGIDGAVLTSGADLPYNTTAGANSAGNTSLSGYPQTDLLTPIATAGDPAQTQATVSLVGTLFAGPEPYVPLPTFLSLADDPSYECPPATNATSSPTEFTTCCVPSPSSPDGRDDGSPLDSSFLPRRTGGDLVITYDVLQSHETTYLALVTLDNDAVLGRLDGWRLSWRWERQEFIAAMRGAYPNEVDAAGCLYGPQGRYYRDLDFSNPKAVLNCDREPVVHDLPPSRADDADLGRIEHCCRNGTLLPKAMDDAAGERRSTSAFQMQVYKMPPDLNRTRLYPPTSFNVSGSSPMNPEFACDQPVRVTASEFPDPSGLASTTVAVATWQSVCNITKSSQPPRCCVSFSAFYNESVVPCRTCACGCPSSATSTCSTTAAALLLPPQALLKPFERRSSEAMEWAEQKRLGPVPSPTPCGDFCGVSINWHVATDYAGGWSARLTVFNWDETDVPDWFAAVVMDGRAYDGFDQAYSFNATRLGDNSSNTIFVRGVNKDFELLLGERNMSGVDYPVPGKQQSVFSFTKKKTTAPGNNAAIDVLAGDGFPSKVFFNGDECAMPLRIPTNAAAALLVAVPTMQLCLLLVVVSTYFLLLLL